MIRAIPTASGAPSELRIETPDFAARYFARSTGGFSMTKPATYGRDIEARLTGGNYQAGMQCYDGEFMTCAADHFCRSTGPMPGNNVEHLCLRRFTSAGLWFNTGVYAPGAYHKGRVWVRQGGSSPPQLPALGRAEEGEPAVSVSPRLRR